MTVFLISDFVRALKAFRGSIRPINAGFEAHHRHAASQSALHAHIMTSAGDLIGEASFISRITPAAGGHARPIGEAFRYHRRRCRRCVGAH